MCVSDTYECCFSMSDKSKGRRSKAVEDSSKRGIRKRRKRTSDHVGKPKSSLSKESALETYNRNKSVDLTDDSLYYLNMISNVGGKPDAKTVNTVSQTDCKIGMFYVRYDIISFCFSG